MYTTIAMGKDCKVIDLTSRGTTGEKEATRSRKSPEFPILFCAGKMYVSLTSTSETRRRSAYSREMSRGPWDIHSKRTRKSIIMLAPLSWFCPLLLRSQAVTNCEATTFLSAQRVTGSSRRTITGKVNLREERGRFIRSSRTESSYSKSRIWNFFFCLQKVC